MTPTLYCQQKGAPLGSDFYYSLKFYKKNQRELLTAIMAFYNEIETITLDYTDLNIAALKLNWWRAEILNIKTKTATHPIAQRFCELHFQNIARLHDIVDGLEQNLTLPKFAKFEDVMIHLMRTAGKRELLIAEVLQWQCSEELIYQFAFIIEFTHYLQHLRTYVKKGLLYFSQEELQLFDVKEMTFFQYKTTPAIQKLLILQYDKILKASESLQKENGDKGFAIRSKLSLSLLEAIRKENFLVLEKFIDITPLYRWWSAWVV